MNGILVQAINAMHDTLNDAVNQQQQQQHDFNNISQQTDQDNNNNNNNDQDNNNNNIKNNKRGAHNEKHSINKKKKTGPKYDSPWICFVKHRSQNIILDKGQKLMTVLANEWNEMDAQQKYPFVEQANSKKISNLNN